MTRPMTPAMETETLAAQLRPFILAYFALDSGDLRLWTGYGDLSWNSFTWTGTGLLGRISTVQETSEIKAVQIEYELSGMPSEVLAIALGEHYQGRADKMWLGCFDEAGAIVPDPKQIRVGRLDTMEVEEDGNSGKIRVSSQNGLAAMDNQKSRRLTHEDQRNLFSGDMFFEFMTAIQNRKISWGAPGPGTD